MKLLSFRWIDNYTGDIINYVHMLYLIQWIRQKLKKEKPRMAPNCLHDWSRKSEGSCCQDFKDSKCSCEKYDNVCHEMKTRVMSISLLQACKNRRVLYLESLPRLQRPSLSFHLCWGFSFCCEMTSIVVDASPNLARDLYSRFQFFLQAENVTRWST